MAQQTGKAAVLSTTLRFLTAGGMTMALALLQEALKPDRDWAMIATMAAGILVGVGVGGGAYGRLTAQEPITSILPK